MPSPQGANRRRLSIEFDVPTLVAIAVGVTAITFLFAISSATANVLILIGIAAVIALALDPLVNAMQLRFQVRRLVAVMVVGGSFILLCAFVVVIMGPPAISQAEKFSKELPDTVEQLYNFPFIGERLEKADAAAEVERWAHELPARLDDKTIADMARSVLGGLLSTFEVAIFAFVLLLDGESIIRRIRRAIPARRLDHADQIGRTFYKLFGRYFAGSLLVAIISGIFVLATGLTLGVPLIPLAALWMVLVDLIPQIGGFLGGSVFVILATTKDLKTGIICLVLFIAYNIFENHVLQPSIVGESVNLSPPTTMMAAIIGGAALGIPGALVATPLAGTIKVLYLELRTGSVSATSGAANAHVGVLARLRSRLRR